MCNVVLFTEKNIEIRKPTKLFCKFLFFISHSIYVKMTLINA